MSLPLMFTPPATKQVWPIDTTVWHARPHADELGGYFVLSHFGEEWFPGISNAEIVTFDEAKHLDGRNEIAWMTERTLFMGCRGGMFDDHPHDRFPHQCVFTLVANHLGILQQDRALQYIAKHVLAADRGRTSHPFHYAEVIKHRYRLLGLKDIVVNTVMDFAALYQAQTDFFQACDVVQGARVLRPYEVTALTLAPEQAVVIHVPHRRTGMTLRLLIANSKLEGLSAAARSQEAGVEAHLVTHFNADGHVYISANERLGLKDLRELVAELRYREQGAKGKILVRDPHQLRAEGTLPDIPEWCWQYGIFNGNLTHPHVRPTILSPAQIAGAAVRFLEKDAWLELPQQNGARPDQRPHRPNKGRRAESRPPQP